MSEKEQHQQLTLFAEGSLAKTYRLPESARVFLESDQDFGSNSIEFLKNLGHDGLLSRTSLACYPATEGPTLPPSFQGWRNAGIGGPTGCLTLSTSEFPRDAAVCSLSEVLQEDVPSKYYLSPRAARGILRRAEKQGKALLGQLQRALIQVASTEETQRGETS